MIKARLDSRLILFGKTAEHTIFKKPIYIHETKKTDYSKKPNEKRRDDSLSRTRNTLYRLIHCNLRRHGDFPPIFLTLTYKQNETNIKTANTDFRNFIKRLHYKVGYKIRYICIPEFQKRGAVHYHIMFFNFPKLQPTQISELWGHGFIRVELAKSIRNVAAYMAKYLSKDILDSRLKGHRILMTSHGLHRPQIFDNTHISRFYENHDIIKTVKIVTTEKRKIIEYKTKPKC